MGLYQFLNSLVGAVALILLGSHAVRVAAVALRQRRAGMSSALVGAATTSQLIGIGLALAGAIGASYVIALASQPFGLQPTLSLLTQLIAALAGSWLVGQAYFGWLAKPVYRWFAGEEGARDAR